MCGIVGFVGIAGASTIQDPMAAVLGMARAISYRGPDDEGGWIDKEAGVALGHRRLSIIDLSAEGHQPMHSACGRYTIVFNGEIYNFADLRTDLHASSAAPGWRGHSDTEVLLACIGAWGFRRTLERCIGMFALAVWDRHERVLYLARDRIGEKPLYYGWSGGAFIFGSELKALRAFPGWSGQIDRTALALFLQRNYVPAPHSIYKGIRKLPPGNFLRLTLEQLGRRDDQVLSQTTEFWSARDVYEKGVAELTHGSDDKLVDDLECLLLDAIRQQMVADVPLGAFLSGGIDSSTIVALMQAQSERPVRTFSIGFHESQYNEAHYALAVAKHVGTEHTELYVRPREALEVIPLLSQVYDEPFADSSQIPTMLVARLARQHVTVSLSGDAGDELFGGYNRYFWGQAIWKRIGWLPQTLRSGVASGLTSVAPVTWDAIYDVVRPLLHGNLKQKRPGETMHKLARVLRSHTPDEMYEILIAHTDTPFAYIRGEPSHAKAEQTAYLPDFVQRMMYADLMSYLPDDILVKVDRASMAVSLESRIPFLDHRVVEFASRLPLHLKVRDGVGKWILRQVLYRYVPRALIERPKMGFGVPIDSWLRGPLREWAESLLSVEALEAQGFFYSDAIRKKWQEHLSGRKNWQYFLWNVLIFQSWIRDTHGTAP